MNALMLSEKNGDWLGWVRFFMEGVLQTAESASNTARRLLDLFNKDRQRIHESTTRSDSALKMFRLLQQHAILSVQVAQRHSKLTEPTIRKAFKLLESIGIIREATGKKRGRQYVYEKYVSILSEGTEPL